eukprot:6125373-Pleurochrysis_carterae.AAC.3
MSAASSRSPVARGSGVCMHRVRTLRTASRQQTVPGSSTRVLACRCAASRGGLVRVAHPGRFPRRRAGTSGRCKAPLPRDVTDP